MQTRAQRRTYHRDIDGLRAIAILAVVLLHAGIPAFRGGYVGVDAFFVISGYLIGAHVYADIRQGQFWITDFYRNRAKRILPALLVVAAFCEIAGLLVLCPVELTMLARYCITTLASAANILAWKKSGYFAPRTDQNPLLMTWSLGVEEQFYIFFPILMLVLARLNKRTMLLVFSLIAIVSLALCWRTTLHAPSAAFYLLPTRAWELAAGVLLAIHEDGRDPKDLYARQKLANALSVCGTLLLAIAIFRFNQFTAFPGLAAVVPVAGSAMLLASSSSYINRTVLGSVPLVFVGQVSYSLYLWHWPLLSFARIISDHPLSAGMGCFIVAVSFVLAWASYLWIEQPFRRSSTPSRALLVRYAMLCGSLAIPAVVIHSTLGFPGRFPRATQLEAAALAEDAVHDCAGEGVPLRSSTCMDMTDPRPAVALLGDSHAVALAPGIAKLAQAQGMKVYRMFMYWCAPVVGVSRMQETNSMTRDCIAYNNEAMKVIVSDPNVRVVVLTGAWAGAAIDQVSYVTAEQVGFTPSESASEANLEKGLRDTVLELRHAGKQVVLVQDAPFFTFNPARRMIADYIPVRSYIAQLLFHAGPDQGWAPLQQTYMSAQRTFSEIVGNVASVTSVPVFDPAANLCVQGRCRYLGADGPLYRDEQHLTKAGAEVALSGFRLPYETTRHPR